VATEQYDLLFSRPFFESDRGERLVEIIRSKAFRDAVESLGGYDTAAAGEILYRQ
jgi:putative molybdopterin biosynthesis protein